MNLTINANFTTLPVTIQVLAICVCLCVSTGAPAAERGATPEQDPAESNTVGTTGIVAPSGVPADILVSIEDWKKFRRLVAQWRTERGATSSITVAAMCDAYQRIIGMGLPAIPLIIAELRSEGDEPDQWFWALQTVSGIDPVAVEDRGNFPRMANSWIAWAEKAGYAG